MAVKLNSKGKAHALALIKAGKVDKGALWSFSAADGNALLGKDKDWANYSLWFLAVNDSEPDKTKGRWEYPFGKGGKVYRKAVIAIKQYAAKENVADIEAAAAELLKAIDGNKGKKELEETITRTIDAKPMDREITAAFDRAAIDEEKREVPLTFSSERVVPQWYGMEMLDHSDGAANLDRLNSGAALRDTHNGDQIGVIVPGSAKVGSDRRGHAIARFGKSARANEVFQDVKDGIRSNVSVRYAINSMQEMMTDELPDGVSMPTGMKAYRVTSWEPIHVSMEPDPADPTVGVGRSAETGKSITIIERSVRSMETCPICGQEHAVGARCANPECSTNQRAAQVSAEEIRRKELQRVADIDALGDAHKMPELARKYIKEGKTLDEFRQAVLENYKAKPVSTDPNIGMDSRDLQQFSLVRAMRDIAFYGGLKGIEREACQAAAKHLNRAPAGGDMGFIIPHDVMSSQFSKEEARAIMLGRVMARALGTTSDVGGGFTVATDVLGSNLIELLRNKTLVAQMGARTLSGLQGNIAIPKQNGGATAYWVGEGADGTESDQAFAQLGLVPHRLVGDTAYQKELLFQSSIDVEGFVRDDLMRVIAIAKDLAAINGSGAAGQPLGILNVPGVGSVTFGGAPTWASVVEFETVVANANADIGNLGYLTTPGVRGTWKTTPKAVNYPVYLWEGNGTGFGQVNGYPAGATNQVPGDKVLYGNWNDLIMADWAGVDVIVDPYTLKLKGQIEVTITLWTDNGIRHAASFTVSTDGGNQ